MEKQIIINAIIALNGTISTLNIAKDKNDEVIKEAIEKLRELIKQL